MTDRELLELAAKAVPIRFRFEGDYPLRFVEYNKDAEQEDWTDWNPLTNDGDAFRLAVKLGLEVYHYDGEGSESVAVGPPGLMGPYEIISHDNDAWAATRRAIVRAAAAIAKGMSAEG